MMSDDHTISRLMLAETMREVRKHVSPEDVKEAWCYKYSYGDNRPDKECEFHGPKGFYWNARCYNLWECRERGWNAYLTKIGVHN